MGSGHGGAGDGVDGGVAGVPGRLDVAAGAEDVKDGAVVGEVGDGPGAVDGADGHSAGSRSWRGVGGIDGVVTGSDDGQDTRGGGRVDGTVEGVRVLATQRHVDDRLAGSALGDDVVDSPVEAGKDDGGGGLSALEDLDGEDVGLLGNTVCLSSDCTGDVGSVADSVGGIAAEGRPRGDGTALELGVSGSNTSINDVGVGVETSVGVIDVAGEPLGTVGNSAQSPGSAGLSSQSLLLESRRLS